VHIDLRLVVYPYIDLLLIVVPVNIDLLLLIV